MKLTQIHTVLEFKQSDWMKKYTDFNIEKKMNVAGDFQKDFFKLMINSVYGKTMEYLRIRTNVRLVNNAKKNLKYTSQTTYTTHKVFGKNYAAFHEIKPVLILSKPIYVGFTLLDLSKWKMYGFHYNFIKKNFDAELLFTDTDNLTDEIKSENVYEQFLSGKICLTLVIIQEIQSFFDEANRKVVKMKLVKRKMNLVELL